jgi:hypothetical protein
MNTSSHPIKQEELMAYLDGELPADRAAVVAAHLEQCMECREWAVDSHALADRVMAWQVAPAPPSLTEHVIAAIPAGEIKPQAATTPAPSWWRTRRFGFPRWALATAGGLCALVLVVAVSMNIVTRAPMSRLPEPADQLAERSQAVSAPAPAPAPVMARKAAVGVVGGVPGGVPAGEIGGVAGDNSAGGGGGGGSAESLSIAVPMIARTASLTLLAKDFDQTRAALEDAVRRHHGYSGQLTVGGETGSGRTLSATFRVPADQLDATLSEIKRLARVERETLGGEEVTDQYVDLSARLFNAHRTEQTLLEVLEKRTGKLADVLAVEEELARVREEIERMDAELKNLQNRVTFATLQVEMHEEYKAALEITPSVGRRMGNALVEGLRTAADSLLGVALFFMNTGPFVLLWGLILFWPVRFLVRRVRSALTKK